jgi:hypothetical protein
MTSLKTVLLGSAASLLAVGVAQAADLPVKKAAAAVQYVEVCPVYGSGFYRLPGTDICVRHFGSVKFNFAFQNERRLGFPDFDQGVDNNIVNEGASNTIGWQWTIRPGWDFRSPTEYGTLRTVVQMRVDQRNGVHENDDPVLTGTMRVSNIIHRGYIEWAGFLIGRAGSQFVYWDQDDVVTAIGGSPKTTAMQFTYVFTAPGGLKATIGVEDSTAWASGFGGFVNVDGIKDLSNGPNRLYDVIGTISTEQSWGNAKLSGALHFTQTNADLKGPGGTDGTPDTNEINTGWAVLAGITFNLPMLGPKDQLLLEATYSDGAVAFSGINGGADNNTTSFERNGQFMSGLQRNDPDTYAFFSGNTWDFETTKVWTVAGQLRHYWSPLWRSNVMASYRSISVPDRAFAATGIGDATAWDVAANLIWGQSRKTAEIGIEAVYKSVSQDLSQNVINAANAQHLDTDPSGWAVSMFIQRAW